MAISADGKRAVTGLNDLRIWNLDTGQEVHRIDLPQGAVVGNEGLAITPDGQQVLALMTASPVNATVVTLRLLDLDTGQPVAQAVHACKQADPVHGAVVLAPDGRLAVTYGGRFGNFGQTQGGTPRSGNFRLRRGRSEMPP